MGKMIELVAGDGFRLSAYRADPDGAPRGGLVITQEIFGVNSHIRKVCDGYAADGYRVVAPALFDRSEKGVDIGYTAEDIARGRQLKAKASIDAALLDVAAARDEAASAGKVGVLGFCWGGYVSWMTASRVAEFFVRGCVPTAEACSRRWANARNVRYWRISASVIRCFRSMACASSPPRIRL